MGFRFHRNKQPRNRHGQVEELFSQQSDSSLQQHPEIGLRNKTKHAPHKLSPCLPWVKAGFVTLCTSRQCLSPTACDAVGTSFPCRLGIRPFSRSCLFRAISVALIPFFPSLIIYPRSTWTVVIRPIDVSFSLFSLCIVCISFIIIGILRFFCYLVFILAILDISLYMLLKCTYKSM